MKKKLTGKQQRFVLAYVKNGGNGAAAARAAGCSSANGADRYMAYQNSTKPYIKAAIEEAARHALTESELTNADVLQGLGYRWARHRRS